MVREQPSTYSRLSVCALHMHTLDSVHDCANMYNRPELGQRSACTIL